MQEMREFIQRIAFHQVHPMDNIALPVPIEFEVRNTYLPTEAPYFVEALTPLLSLPRLSSFAIGTIIHALTRQMPAEAAFLNIGVWCGFSLLAGMVGNPQKICLGVDNFCNLVGSNTPFDLGGAPRETFLPAFEQLKSPQHHFFEMDFRKYFSEIHTQPLGLYIYDADHDFEAQLAGLQLAEPFLLPGAYILIDDTNWLNVYKASLQFISQSKHRYEIVLDSFTAHNGHPTFWNGLLILQKMN